MKKTLQVLHIASFEGNLGDNANHNGTRKLYEENLTDFQFNYTELEIREYFWKIRKFDDDFVDLANQYDLVIIGGGNYFEMWVESSCNSTSVDVPITILEKISTPFIFYALGVDPAQGIANVNKFRIWLNYIIQNKDKYILSTRNDGGLETLETYLGIEYSNAFHHVPDGGFFLDLEDYYHPEIPESKKIIGINIAGDMPEVRFPDQAQGINYEEFIHTFASVLNKLLSEDEEIHIVFFPHIYKDLYFVSALLKSVKDWHNRKRITVAPYLHGEDQEKYLFDAYRKCNLIIGNRFHANVCAIGLKIPTIGLVNYRQIEKLYQELEINDRTVQVNKIEFDTKLISMITDSLDDAENISSHYGIIVDKLKKEKSDFHIFINNWLKRIGK